MSFTSWLSSMFRGDSAESNQQSSMISTRQNSAQTYINSCNIFWGKMLSQPPFNKRHTFFISKVGNTLSTAVIPKVYTNMTTSLNKINKTEHNMTKNNNNKIKINLASV